MTSQPADSQTSGAGIHPQARSTQPDMADTASVLSSRMTDIASDDGGEHSVEAYSQRIPSSHQRRSIQTTTSRPNTGVTGNSAPRGAFTNMSASRRAPISGSHRGSGVGSISGTSRPLSSRTQGPSISSQAFFRPMSSQKLQAQRAGSRPNTTQRQVMASEGDFVSVGDRNSYHSVQTARGQPGQQVIQDDVDQQPPPSRGTEFTEQEAADRMTANTSPQGYYAPGSLSESVRPLQKPSLSNTKGLSLDVTKNTKSSNNLSTPAKSPRSFRSNFLMPSRGDRASVSPNRSMQGREKLSSVASSPGLVSIDTHHKSPPRSKSGGVNYQFFQGSTVFFWGGRLQNTRDKPVNIATGLLVVLPAVLWFVFSAPWIWRNVSPAIPIIFGYIFFLCMSSFFHASLSDPGVSHSLSAVRTF